MNIINRLNNLEEKAALLEGKSGKSFLVMFNDNGRLYTYDIVDGKEVKVYPTKEELDENQKSHKAPIITFHTSLDQENLLT